MFSFWQVLLDLLFEPGVLEENLRWDTNLARNLASFSRDGKEQGGAIGLHFSVFFLSLSRSLSCTLDNIREDNPGAFQPIPETDWAHSNVHTTGAFWELIKARISRHNVQTDTLEREIRLINYYRVKSFEQCSHLRSVEDAADFAAGFAYLREHGLAGELNMSDTTNLQPEER